MSTITPKLIDQSEASEVLGIGLSNFKKLEKEGAISIQKKDDCKRSKIQKR